jgi:hypothetical protein
MLRRWDVSTELDGEARKHSDDDRVDGTFFVNHTSSSYIVGK